MMIPNKWQDNYDQGYDYGIISIGKSLDTGYLGMLVKTDTQLKNMSLVGVYGYPGTSGITQGTLWYSSGKVIATDPQMFTYTATTGGGFSGGSVVDMSNFRNIVSA